MLPGFNNKTLRQTAASTVADVTKKTQLRQLSLEVANEGWQSDNFLVVIFILNNTFE
jgi:hypothetical protein